MVTLTIWRQSSDRGGAGPSEGLGADLDSTDVSGSLECENSARTNFFSFSPGPPFPPSMDQFGSSLLGSPESQICGPAQLCHRFRGKTLALVQLLQQISLVCLQHSHCVQGTDPLPHMPNHAESSNLPQGRSGLSVEWAKSSSYEGQAGCQLLRLQLHPVLPD